MCSNPVLILIIVDTARRWVFAIFLFKGNKIKLDLLFILEHFDLVKKQKKRLMTKDMFYGIWDLSHWSECSSKNEQNPEIQQTKTIRCSKEDWEIDIIDQNIASLLKSWIKNDLVDSIRHLHNLKIHPF